jgi:OOP family OmpA-OmpF porin
MNKHLFIATLAVLSSGFAFAQNEAPVVTEAPVAEEAPATEESGGTYSAPSSSYIGILGTYLFQDTTLIGDNERNLGDDNGAGAQFIYGFHNNGGLGFEFTLFGEIIETGTSSITDFYRPGAGIDLVYSFGDRQGFTPFVLLGGGGAYNDVVPDNLDKVTGYGNAGLGFITGNLGKGVHIRGEARYIYDTFLEDFEDVRVGLGLEIALWDQPQLSIQPEQPAQIVEVVKEISTGLTDADGDGIIDSKDKCPDTPAGTRVDGDGCPLAKVLALKGVTFEFNKAILRPDSKAVLDYVTEIMKRYPDLVVELAGHTDNIGGDAYNQKLSQERADAVRTYLLAQGIASENMTAVGYGEAEPVASNDTDEGREQNRRVELRVKN